MWVFLKLSTRFIYLITQSTQVLEDWPVVKIISEKRKKI